MGSLRGVISTGAEASGEIFGLIYTFKDFSTSLYSVRNDESNFYKAEVGVFANFGFLLTIPLWIAFQYLYMNRTRSIMSTLQISNAH